MTSRRRRRGHPFFVNHESAIAAGILSVLVAAWCFEDAWEGRGRKRPFFAKMLPV
jgi:hypothetical protein